MELFNWQILFLAEQSRLPTVLAPFLWCASPFSQALLLLAYLIRNGSERVVTSAREHIYDLRSLENYHLIGKLLTG